MMRFLASAAVVLGLLTASPHRLGAQLRTDKPQIEHLVDGVYLASGYALGNVILVATSEGLVVIDTTENPLAAAQILADFRARLAADGGQGDLPVKTIIYTHHHGDHINGARVFWSEGVQVIAQAKHGEEMEKFRLIYGYNTRLNTIQWGSALPAQRRGIVLGLDPRKVVQGYRPPDITFESEHKFTLGGVRFELFHTEGETLDHLMVWLPDLGVLCPGDLWYAAFPMLASPMKPDRPVRGWIASLERMRTLKPRFLAPSHSLAVVGANEVDAVLANYAAAIRHVHDETIKALNRGISLEELQRTLRLPPELASLPYLQPLYGRVEWGASGIYRQYTGWYDMQPGHLNPGPVADRSAALLEVAGGTDPVLARAQRALEEGHAQLALELAEVILAALPDHRPTHALAAQALEQLAALATNPVEVNVYRGAAQEHHALAEGEASAESGDPAEKSSSTNEPTLQN